MPDDYKLALVADVPERVNESSMLGLVDSAPVWRRLTPHAPGLYDIAAAMDFGPPGSKLWIIGNYPSVVVAVGPPAVAGAGTSTNGQSIRFKIGGDLSLVSEADLDVAVSELRVLDAWPSRAGPATGAGNASLSARPVALERPTTIRQLLEKPPWRKE